MNETKKSKVAIFVIYHKESPIYESDIFHPIQTGCANTSLDLGILKDNIGNNISFKNTHYAELTAQYWVWKNYLKDNPQTEYIGFCHYRRFLDFNTPAKNNTPFSVPLSHEEFRKKFNKEYSEKIFYKNFKGYDIILPEPYHLVENALDQYMLYHPNEEFFKMINLVKRLYPSYVDGMDDYLKSNVGYYCLNFIMKTDYFLDFIQWAFHLLDEMDKISDWTQYTAYNEQKTPAFLMERFFNVWLRYQIKTKSTKIIERESVLLG